MSSLPTDAELRDEIARTGQFWLAPHLFPTECAISRAEADALARDPVYRRDLAERLSGNYLTRVAMVDITR